MYSLIGTALDTQDSKELTKEKEYEYETLVEYGYGRKFRKNSYGVHHKKESK